MNIILIGLIALSVLIGGWYGAENIFKFKGEVIDTPQEFASDLPDRFPKNISQDLSQIIKETPWDEFKNFFFGGTKGVVSFLGRLITQVVEWVLNFVKPGIQLPSYTPLVIGMFIGVLVLWAVLGNIYGFLYGGLKWMVLISGLGIGVFFILVFLGLV